jgi:heat shock protein HtpX
MQFTKIFVMMAGLTALLAAFGGYFGGQSGAILVFILAAVMNFGMFWFSDKVVLRMYRARTIGPDEAPDLFRMVDRLRQRAELPMPVVAIAASDQPNAFATGRNPEKAVVCVTAGILRALPPRELEGVIAHELAHIKHRHMLTGTVAATMAGAVGILASMARWAAIFAGGRDDDRNPLGLIVMSIVAPIAAMIIQFAISRQNEFQADQTGGQIAGDPLALAGALERLDSFAKRIPMRVNPAGAHLAIVNPLAGARGGGMTRLFRTHPDTAERVSRLREQASRGAF